MIYLNQNKKLPIKQELFYWFFILPARHAQGLSVR